MRNYILKSIFILAVALASAQNMSGWGWAHQLIAYVAHKHLTPTTVANLENYVDGSIVELSLWMDNYRKSPEYRPTDSWHMVVYKEDLTPAMTPRYGGISGQCVPRLTDAIELLRNYKELSDSTVLQNLRYVVHSVGDMHCPAHTYFHDTPEYNGKSGYLSRLGWAPVTYKGKKTSPHGLYDGGPERIYPELEKNLGKWRKMIDTFSVEKMRAVAVGTPYDWACDNVTRTRDIYDIVEPGQTVDDSFFHAKADLIIYQLQIASYRLAQVLNELFDPEFKELN